MKTELCLISVKIHKEVSKFLRKANSVQVAEAKTVCAQNKQKKPLLKKATQIFFSLDGHHCSQVQPGNNPKSSYLQLTSQSDHPSNLYRKEEQIKLNSKVSITKLYFDRIQPRLNIYKNL